MAAGAVSLHSVAGGTAGLDPPALPGHSQLLQQALQIPAIPLLCFFSSLLSSLLMVTTKCLFSRNPFELYGLAMEGTCSPP